MHGSEILPPDCVTVSWWLYPCCTMLKQWVSERHSGNYVAVVYAVSLIGNCLSSSQRESEIHNCGTSQLIIWVIHKQLPQYIVNVCSGRSHFSASTAVILRVFIYFAGLAALCVVPSYSQGTCRSLVPSVVSKNTMLALGVCHNSKLILAAVEMSSSRMVHCGRSLIAPIYCIYSSVNKI